VAGFNSILRANLDAGVTFPALLWLLIVGFHCVPRFRAVLVQLHQVVWADVHASGLFQTFAAITLVGTYERRHGITPFLLLSVKSFFASGEALQRVTDGENPMLTNKLRSPSH
jgi:hypothetical protein